MTSKYERYSKEELVRIIEERDRKPKFGLVLERDEIDHDRSLSGISSCPTAPTTTRTSW
jgi:adenine-specific DNA-methyltransferase